MSNVAALLAGRADAVGDGIYLERADPKELALEEHLRALVARAPRLVPLAKRWRRFTDAAAAREAEMKALGDTGLAAFFRARCRSRIFRTECTAAIRQGKCLGDFRM